MTISAQDDFRSTWLPLKTADNMSPKCCGLNGEYCMVDSKADLGILRMIENAP